MSLASPKRKTKNTFPVATARTAPVIRWSLWNVGRIRLFGIYVNFKYFILLLAEFAVMSIATYFCYAQAAIAHPESLAWVLSKSLFAAGVFILCFAGLGLYSSRQTLTGGGVLLRYVVASAITLPVLGAVNMLTQANIEAMAYTASVGLSILFLASVRALFRSSLDSDLLKRRVLLVGNGIKAAYVRQVANEPDQRGFTLIEATVDLTLPGSLASVVKHYRVNEVVVAFDDRRKTLPVTELLACRLSGVSVVDVLNFLERECGVIAFEHLNPSWLIFTEGFGANVISRAAKRVFDVMAALLLIVIAMPVIVLSALAIKLDFRSPGPVFYKQIRVGSDGQNFNVFKFRSMRTDAEKNGQAQWATPNDSRVTAVGAVLRKYRIDELPQLFNVLMGTMSLVGPRPERPIFVTELSKLSELYSERHRVKPGVTGWAQLRYPYTDDEEGSIQKLRYDMYYLKNQGFFFDMYILLQTIEVVLFGKGAR